MVVIFGSSKKNKKKSFLRRKDSGAPLPEEAGAQAERIAYLKGEVERLSAELDNYKKREREIQEVLAFAKNRSEDYEKEARIRFALEAERLAAYRDKWAARLRSLSNADKLGEEVLDSKKFFEDLAEELTVIAEGGEIKRSEPREQYYRECVRLNELGASEPRAEARLSEAELTALLAQLGNK